MRCEASNNHGSGKLCNGNDTNGTFLSQAIEIRVFSDCATVASLINICHGFDKYQSSIGITRSEPR